MANHGLQLSDGVTLYFEIHGRGAPLLLVAGLASDSQSWGPIVEALAHDFQVIILDNRGVGRSTQVGVEISIPIMVDDCVALLDHLGIASVHILGHSMGGFVALECGLRYPGRVSTLTLAATSLKSPAESTLLFQGWAESLSAGCDLDAWFRGILPWMFSGSFLEDVQAVDSAIRFAVEYPFPQSAEAFRKQVQAIAAFDRRGQIAAFEVPVLIVHGREDRLFPVAKSISGFSAARHVRTMVIERAAHSLHLEQPEAFLKAVRGFLKDSYV